MNPQDVKVGAVYRSRDMLGKAEEVARRHDRKVVSISSDPRRPKATVCWEKRGGSEPFFSGVAAYSYLHSFARSVGREVPDAPPAPDLCIRVWRFEDAPAELQALSTHGGDEDWLAVVPAGLAGTYIGWLESRQWGKESDDAGHVLPDGSTVYIGAHA